MCQLEISRLTAIFLLGSLNIIILPTIVNAHLLTMSVRLPSANLVKPEFQGFTQYNKQHKNQDFDTFLMPNEYSIRYPKGWYVNVYELGKEPRNVKPIEIYDKKIYVSSQWNSEIIKLVYTIIYPVSVPFHQMIRESTKTSNHPLAPKIMRKGYTTIGGREAYRIWRAYDSKTDGRYEIETLIHHTNETMVISSLYFPSHTPIAVPIIQQIHGSYQSLRP